LHANSDGAPDGLIQSCHDFQVTPRQTGACPMPNNSPAVRRWLTTAAELAAIVLVITVAKAAIAEPYYVPSGSMEPTLLIGDEMLATKFPYGYSSASLPLSLPWPRTERILGALPERGDVVVFRYPGNRSQVWVKRVIGLPGDRVQMREGRLWINGEAVGLKHDGSALSEGSVEAERYIETLPGGRTHPILKLSGYNYLDNTPEVTVPANHLFVMGDNRDNSADSRISPANGGVGLLPTEDLIGRVESIVASWDLTMKQEPVWTWPSGLRFARFFTSVR
jgi:signal peptidase I